MLKITGGVGKDCEGFSRRSFLQAGVLGLGGMTMADVLRLRASAASGGAAKDTSVILFWLSGGPGHMETFDPKPDAVDQFRGPFGAISTSVSGVQFGELMPHSASMMDHLAILRSVNHGTGDHTKGNHWMLTGFEGPDFNAADNTVQRRPSMGSAVAKLRGANRPAMPPYVGVPHLRGGTENLFHYSVYLGGGANPFIVNSDPNVADFRVRDLSLASDLTFERLESRRSLLSAIDQMKRGVEPGVDDRREHQQRAFELLTSREVVDAFDISKEAPKSRDAYGRHVFGQSALLARRLVEHGVTFVTVNCVPWDHHGTAGRLPTAEGARLLIPPVDVAIAALTRDLIDRGLYEKTLIVAMGEFGRTPRMNSSGGRDHWGHAFSVLMGCGSMKMGQIIGRSSERGEYVTDRPISPQDVASTVYHHLGIDGQKVVFPAKDGRPLHLIENGAPIQELVG